MNRTDKNIENLLKYGIDENLAQKIASYGLTISKIRVLSKADLIKQNFTDDEISMMKEKAERQEINDTVLQQLIQDTELHCCICQDIDNAKPVIIHHINEYNKSQDNSYDNLIVVCLNHHADIHTIRQISQQNYPPTKLIDLKNKFVKSLKEYRAGKRVAPGRENLKDNPSNYPDLLVLEHYKKYLFERDAFFDSFEHEYNYHNFIDSIDNIINGLKSGIIKETDGYIHIVTKPHNQFSNVVWLNIVIGIVKDINDVRKTYKTAIKENKIQISPDGDGCRINDRAVNSLINTLRKNVITKFNEILKLANIQEIDIHRFQY